MKATVKDKRPVNLDIGTIELPLAAYASILHRISGVIVFGGIAVLLYLLDKSLSGTPAFADLQSMFSSVPFKLFVWAILAALVYHMIAGCKHLLMDLGIGESKEQGPKFALVSMVLSVVAILALGVWLW